MQAPLVIRDGFGDLADALDCEAGHKFIETGQATTHALQSASREDAALASRRRPGL